VTRSRKIVWALAAVVVGYVGIGALPSGAELLSGAREKEQRRAAVLEQTALADEVIAEGEAFDDRLAALRTAVPADAGLPSVIALIERAVLDSGMVWVSGAPSPIQQAEGAQTSEWQLAVTINGSARELPRLLEALRDLPRLVVVDSVQVRDDAAATIQLTVRFFATVGDPASYEPADVVPVAPAPTTTLPPPPTVAPVPAVDPAVEG